MSVSKLRSAAFPDARVVVVDDQQVNVDVLTRLLRKAGYENIRGVTDPRQLFEELDDEGWDILLLDIHMPHIDGIEAIRRVREQEGGDGGRLPILTLTADASEETKLEALAAGADDFLTKPFEASEVLLRVHNLLAMHFAFLRLRNYSGNLEIEVGDRTRQLEKALVSLGESREQALWIVGLTLEYRDFETKGHTDRVTKLALSVGESLELDDAQIRDLRWGSYLHDTGKIAIPDQILLKPGKLTPEEFTRMKEHVLVGEEMLRKLDFLPDTVLGVVRNHHERWDGGGYPDGLHADTIPLLARIFTVVDVYDALTSKRPYKPAWTSEDALTEIRDNQGTQFDPSVVDAFLTIKGT